MVSETMYCVKCRKKVKSEVKPVTMKNKRKAVTGKCPSCGTKVFKMVGGGGAKKKVKKKVVRKKAKKKKKR